MASAAPYPERAPLGWRWLDVSPATACGLRYGIGVCSAIWIGHLPGLVTNESQWILITVLMVMQPEGGGSLSKGLLRAAGTAAAAFTAIFLFGWFAQDPPLLLAGLLLVQGIAAYGFSGPRFQYAWFVWAFTTAIVLGAAMSGSENVETLAFQRASMVGIGLLIVFVLDALLWPDRSEAAALVASIVGVAHALESGPVAPGPRLRDAHAEVEARLDALLGRPDIARQSGPRVVEAFLATIAQGRALVASQLAIEGWLADWREAQ